MRGCRAVPEQHPQGFVVSPPRLQEQQHNAEPRACSLLRRQAPSAQVIKLHSPPQVEMDIALDALGPAPAAAPADGRLILRNELYAKQPAEGEQLQPMRPWVEWNAAALNAPGSAPLAVGPDERRSLGELNV